MKVLGHEIEQAVIDRAVLSFPPDRSFRFMDMASALTRSGVPYEVSDRCADRVLQRLRKAGTHTFSGGLWRRRKITAIAE